MCSIRLQDDCDSFSVSTCAHVFCEKCFKNMLDQEVPVNCTQITALILSIKASATGLNLTMANHVIIVDPWSPAIEEQAIGRAHRIGQTKQVFVKRFLCKDTVEQKINILHQKKKNIFQNAMNTQVKKLDKEEIQFLLQ